MNYWMTWAVVNSLIAFGMPLFNIPLRRNLNAYLAAGYWIAALYVTGTFK